MKRTILLFLFIVNVTCLKATIYNVQVTNNSFLSPPLVLNQGDVVTWTNVAGFHNVNGSLATYPANPEGFISGGVAGAPWTYSKTFTVLGVYNYRCDAHFPTMVGTITVNGPLPVELKYITASVQSGVCQVEWKTEKEENLKSFTLQKSLNAVDFSDVIGIDANHVPSVYSYMDEMGIDKFVYYRILITDDNNNVKYSPVKLAQNDIKVTKNTLTLMPNPYVEHFHVSVQSVSDWAGQVEVFDMTGRTIITEDYHFTEGHNYVHLDGSDKFPKGLYLVTVRNRNNKEFMSATVVKQ